MDRTQEVDKKNRVICLFIMFTPRVIIQVPLKDLV